MFLLSFLTLLSVPPRTSLHLSTSVAPQIVPFDFGSDLFINTGDMTSLQCTVSKGDFPIEISWTLGTSDVGKIEGIAVSQVNKRINTLSIESVEARHAGNYTCTARNPAGTDSFTATLNVNGTSFLAPSFLFVLPPTLSACVPYSRHSVVYPQIAPFEFSHGEESINSGETVAAQCIILKGDSPLNFTWTLNGRKIGPDDRVTITTLRRLSTLSVDSVQDAHTGEYRCVVTNPVGTSSFSANLKVNGTAHHA